MTTTTPHKTIKLLYSYGGKILPRPSDHRLRYFGGLTRVASTPRSTTFSELTLKLSNLCGYSISLRCQLPNEDLDVLISIKTDEDLSNLIEEYDRASLLAGKELKIRAILSPLKSSAASSSSSSSSSAADISPSVVIRRFPARKPATQYFHYHPCHLQTNSNSNSSSSFRV